MEVAKVPPNESLADAMTKGVESETLKFHIHGVSAEIRRDRHDLAPRWRTRNQTSWEPSEITDMGGKCFMALTTAEERNVSWGSNVGMLKPYCMVRPDILQDADGSNGLNVSRQND